jgi:hypothetical protein
LVRPRTCVGKLVNRNGFGVRIDSFLTVEAGVMMDSFLMVEARLMMRT